MASALTTTTGIARVAASALQLREHVPAGHVGQVEVEQDQVRPVLPGEVQAQAALHGGHQPDLGMVGQQVLDERQVGKVVLDVEDVVCAGERVHAGGRASVDAADGR